MFLRRLVSNAEPPRHPPRSRSPSPPRVKRIEMKDMPEPSEDVRAASRHASYTAAYPNADEPDADLLRASLARAATESAAVQPSLPTPEEGVVGFDELLKRNERLRLGYENAGLPIARLSCVGMPSPPASRPVSQNVTGFYKQDGNGSRPDSVFDRDSSQYNYSSSASSISDYSPDAAEGSLKTTGAGVGTSTAVRRSVSYAGPRRKASRSSVASANRFPKRRVTIHVRHLPGKSRLSQVHSPTEETTSSRTSVKGKRRAVNGTVEEQVKQLQVHYREKDVALNATLEELDVVKTELARMKRRARQQKRSAAKEREFVAEDLADTHEDLGALLEECELLEQDSNSQQITPTQLQRRLVKQVAAFELLKKQVAEREEAIKALDIGAAEKDLLLAGVASSQDKLNKLQDELDAQRQRLYTSANYDQPDSVYTMRNSALVRVVANLHSQNKALTVARDTADESKSYSERMLAGHKARTAEQQNKISELSAATSALSDTVEKFEAALAGASVPIGSTEQSKAELESELAAVKARLVQSQERIAALPTKEDDEAAEEVLTRDVTTAVELETQIADLTSALSLEQANVDKLQDELESLVEETTKRDALLSAEIDTLKESLATTKAEKEELAETLDTLTAESDRLNVKAFNIIDEHSRSLAEVERMAQEKVALVEKVGELQKQNEVLVQASEESPDYQVALLRQVNDYLKKKNGELQTELTTNQERVVQLKNDLVNANGQIATLQVDLKQLAAHTSVLENEEVRYKVQIQSLDDRLEHDRFKKDQRFHSSSRRGTLRAKKNEELIVVKNASAKTDKASIVQQIFTRGLFRPAAKAQKYKS